MGFWTLQGAQNEKLWRMIKISRKCSKFNSAVAIVVEVRGGSCFLPYGSVVEWTDLFLNSQPLRPSLPSVGWDSWLCDRVYKTGKEICKVTSAKTTEYFYMGVSLWCFWHTEVVPKNTEQYLGSIFRVQNLASKNMSWNSRLVLLRQPCAISILVDKNLIQSGSGIFWHMFSMFFESIFHGFLIECVRSAEVTLQIASVVHQNNFQIWNPIRNQLILILGLWCLF